jgi:TolA-binding protein
MARAHSRTAARALARWARCHLSAWIVGASAFSVALAALLAVLIALPGQSDATVGTLILVLVVVLVLSVVFPVAGHVVGERDLAAERQREQLEQAAKEAQAKFKQIDWLLSRGSSAGLPRLSELGDDLLGATPTRYSIEGNAPYVPRPTDDEAIRRMLRQPGPAYPFVIVWGTTKAGKSRTLAEALRATFGGDVVVVLARDGRALAELARLGVRELVDHRPAIVVLDDLDPARLEALTAEVLDLIRGWAVIAATMTAQRRADVLTTGSDVGTVARAALAAASGEYELPAEPPTGKEKDQAVRLYPRERFDGSVAETLVGARELIGRYKASHDTNPVGCALVRAAIDVRRAGITRPVTETELWRLFAFYLSSIRTGMLPTTEHFTSGIEWATQPVASQVALLRQASSPHDMPAWIIFDHAVTADEGQGSYHRPIPDAIWPELIDMIPARDAFPVGMAAYACGVISAAIAAFRKGTTTEQADAVPMAAFNLGVLLESEGDVEGARTAYQMVIDSGPSPQASRAAFLLGSLLASQGDVDGARAAYQTAVDSGHANVASAAAYRLSEVLRIQGDFEAADAAYHAAIDSRQTELAPLRAYFLGAILGDEGDVDGARAVYQTAIDSSHADHAPEAARGLGRLLAGQGDVDGARAAFQLAIDSGHADHAPRACPVDHGTGSRSQMLIEATSMVPW